CDALPLKQLTVREAYIYLMRQKRHPSAVPSTPCIHDTNAQSWHKSWAWLQKAPFPNLVRQFMWRRWHSRLYLGERSDRRKPPCPFCLQPDSVTHFAKECPRVQLHALLDRYWDEWSGSSAPVEWWLTEFSPDWRWMLFFA